MNLGIFSISHKIELKEFHDVELHYNGDVSGSWELLKCSETRGKYAGKRVWAVLVHGPKPQESLKTCNNTE